MKIWIFIAIINWNGHQLRVATDNIKYAFTSKEACEYAIAESQGKLMCIELELI